MSASPWTRRRCFVRIVVLAMLLALAALPGTATGLAGSGCPHVVPAAGGWSSISLPSFAKPAATQLHGGLMPPQAVDYDPIAVDPAAANRLFATNGESVERSTDGGCSWTTVFDLNAMPAGADGPDDLVRADSSYSVVSVKTASRGAVSDVYVLLESASAPVVIEASTDGGANWTAQLPKLGAAPTDDATSSIVGQAYLAVAPSAPATLYLAGETGGGVVGLTKRTSVLYVSRDAGATWRQGIAAGLPAGWANDLGAGWVYYEVYVYSLMADPANPSTVWYAAGPGGAGSAPPEAVYRSTDAGDHFKLVLTNPKVSQDTYNTSLVGFSSSGASHCVTVRNVATAYRSIDNGTRWARLPTPPYAGHGHDQPYLEAADCLADGRVIEFVGYRAQSIDMPPFATQAVYVSSRPGARRFTWTMLSAPPVPASSMWIGQLIPSTDSRRLVLYWLYVSSDATHDYGSLLRFASPTLGAGG